MGPDFFIRRPRFAFVIAILTVLVGLLARVLIADSLGGDPEMAFPLLADSLLPGVLVGLMLAGLFAATIAADISRRQ